MSTQESNSAMSTSLEEGGSGLPLWMRQVSRLFKSMASAIHCSSARTSASLGMSVRKWLPDTRHIWTSMRLELGMDNVVILGIQARAKQ